MLNNNSDTYRKSLVDDLLFLKDYISQDYTLQYSNKDYQATKDTLYYRNVCDLIKDVFSVNQSLDDAGRKECSSIRSATFLNGITPTLELAKSYTRSLIFQEGSVKIDLTHEILFEYGDILKYVNMGLDLMVSKTMSSIQDTHYFNLVFNCVTYSLLIVPAIN